MTKKELRELYMTLSAEIEYRKRTGGYSHDAEAFITIFQTLALLTSHLIGKTK